MAILTLHDRPPIRGVFRSDEEALGVYSESAGVARLMPRGVAVPLDPHDVECLVQWASQERIPLIARGSGSSMCGSAVGDGVIVDLSRLRRLDPIDLAWNRVWGEPGVVRREVERAANALQLRFPVDPSSGSFATIGGMASTNAAGPRSMQKGAMRRWVTALDCVFADGHRATLRRGHVVPTGVPALDRWRSQSASIQQESVALGVSRVAKESSGYGVHDFAASGELLDLLIGSEGTLAIFVGVELALDNVPMQTASVLAAWPTLDGAVRGAALAREAGAAACELLDRTFLDVAASAGPLAVPRDSEAVLLIEMEGDALVSERAKALARAFESAGAGSVMVGLDVESEEALWALRHAASPILSRLNPHLKSMQLVEDGCVPPHRLGDYVRGVRAALEAVDIRGVIFGHAGDAHVHVNALVDVRDDDWRPRVRTFFESVVALTALLGGTLAGEHGDGRLRTPHLHRTWSREALGLFGRIKNTFDPLGILNPGVKVAHLPLDILSFNKYDPSLPPLCERAQAVLARVERERAYDHLRLEMLTEG